MLLAALVVGGTLADAQSPPLDRRMHLLVVPHSPEGRAALGRSDARVVARYEEFTLVEAAGADDERLRRAGGDRRDDMLDVTLPAAELDPRRDRASLAAKRAERDETLALVQFVGPVKESWLERLEETGARVVQYAPQNAYLVHADDEEVQRLAGLVGTDTAVRAVTPVAAADKVDHGLARGDERTMAVQTIAGEPGAPARRKAVGAGRMVRSGSSVGALRTQFVRIDGAEAAALAEEPGVVSITPWSPPRLLDERAAQIVAGNLLPSGAPSGPGYLDWLAGQGVPSTTFQGFAIDIADQGLDDGADPPGHPDFYENGAAPGPDRVDYAVDYTSDGGPNPARDCGGHGTNVASIAAGHGAAGPGREDEAGFLYGLGIAPQARLGASKIFTCTGAFGLSGAFEPVVSAAHAAGARISNNSWGFEDRASLGAYTVDSQEFDELVRDARPNVAGNQQMIEVFAAGNQGDDSLGGSSIEGYGSVAPPGTAKNVITVGASENARAIGGSDGCLVTDAEADDARDILDFSGRGPTDDLRLKPDVVAPGTHIVGASPQHSDYTGANACNPRFPAGNTLYSLISGTSQAAPEVAGAAAIVYDWFRRLPAGTPPSPAMTKAVLVNTASDLAGGDGGKGAPIESAPNTDEGWGRVNLGAVLDSTAREFVDQSQIVAATGGSAVRSYAVQDPGIPVKVTLAWTDPPGMVGPGRLVNDLNLIVEAGGHTYGGNVLAGGVSRTGGPADRRNNVESVFLPPGTNGRFAVRVVGANIAGDGVPGNADGTDQDFALVVSNADEQPAPVLVHDSTTIADAEADGALEPGETFTLTERLRNAGNATATGVSGSVSGTDLTFSQASSTWPNLAAGAAAANSPPFAGTLSPGATCGADVTATLSLTTQGSESVPITLPTGESVLPTLAARAHSPPVAIPDDSAAGVTSTLEVTNPGRIKDLNVRIDSITHPFVGDLRIDLTGPDGTTVTLTEHPGGPDNAGRDFVGTVFDDEAAADVSAGSAPYTGSFRPQNDQLSRFDGKDRAGTWTLRVRDLGEFATGTLGGWATQTRIAGCDAGGTGPDTTIDSPTPASPSESREATFRFGSSALGADFECRLDSGDYVECSSPHTYSGLPDGSHTVSVRAIDATGNVDTTPDSHTWTVDAPPDTVIQSGPDGLTASPDAAFAFTADEAGHFECRLDGSGPFVECTSPTAYSGLADGAHRFEVRAVDESGKTDPTPAERIWTVATTPPDTVVQSGPAGPLNNPGASAPVTSRVDTTPPAFALAPAEENLAGAVSRGVPIFAGCASACRVSATLSLTAAKARAVGLPSGGRALGALKATLAQRGARAFALRPSPLVRRALRRLRSLKATLNVEIAGAGTRVRLRHSVTLTRTAGLRRIARSGLSLRGACSESCTMSARLVLPAANARRLGLKAPGGAALTVARASARAGQATSRLVLAVDRRYRRTLRHARRGTKATLAAVVEGSTGPQHRLSRRLTLNR